MYFNDHPPPHFHAVYGEEEAEYAVDDGRLLEGWLPKRAARLVAEWALEHRRELATNWARRTVRLPLLKIGGLDAD